MYPPTRAAHFPACRELRAPVSPSCSGCILNSSSSQIWSQRPVNLAEGGTRDPLLF
ncbi:hypothetical protein TRIATDRAFT_255649 [Trichoderma atroviride IMI 206040]|uniref:Uncharacterized protein n=1 Tax=Hypocrea atroviridis (strain ATCC 20476 / IMI 206040) TaxID=452589 RepID=G9NMI8_HYPAI|nr:uncharacterized protein TRIATDRAFT_298323 [Trichoderma atroviride IMI 206040]EHK48117.1 hypothetical protein TRIATDRAFT_255649 [Trichoderma atroviride IMI 206040]